MAERFGIDAIVYYDADGAANDDFDELECLAGDVQVSIEIVEQNTTTRKQGRSGWKTSGGKMKNASIELPLIVDHADLGFIAMETAFFGEDNIGLMILDGPDTTVGSRGLKADFRILSWVPDFTEDGQQMVRATVKPARSATDPEWHIVASS